MFVLALVTILTETDETHQNFEEQASLQPSWWNIAPFCGDSMTQAQTASSPQEPGKVRRRENTFLTYPTQRNTEREMNCFALVYHYLVIKHY